MPDVTGPAVTLDGTAIEGAQIAVINNDTGAVLGETTTDVDGNWAITVSGGQTVHVLAEYDDGAGNLYQEHSKPFVAVESTEPAFWSNALHRYNHDEGSGSTVTDTGAAGTLSDGTITGSVWDSTVSQYQGVSLSHDGTDDYVTATRQDTMDGFTTGMSAVCWVRPRDVTARQTLARVHSSWDFRIDSGQWHIYMWDESTGNYTRWVFNSPAPATDTWYRAGFRWTSGAHPVVFVDGATYTHDATGGAGVAVDTVSTSTNNLEMPADTNYYNGYLDGPLMIWDYALTDQEVQDDYNAFA